MAKSLEAGSAWTKTLEKMLRRWRRHMTGLEREATESQVIEDGQISYSFFFLVIASCSIATLGLMLNSAAVIIGAMLVAPLMGPIVLLGFCIAKTDVELAVHGSKAMLVGIVGALGTSWLIVTISPYIPPTPEILARTNPNLFDLLVAVMSGLVAGYAVIRRKIGTVAGVAIATALMPPLAASGYGLSIGDTRIFQGAFYLFLTNMVAIAFSVAGMAAWYGFGNLHARENLLWETLGAALILGLLSVPLINTLNESVSKTLTLKKVEEIIRSEFAINGNSLEKLAVEQPEGKALHTEVTLFVREYDQNAETRMARMLKESLRQNVTVALNQVVVGDSVIKLAERRSVIANPVAASVAPKAEPMSASEVLSRYITEIMPLPIMLSQLDTNRKSAKLQIGSDYRGSLLTLLQMERQLQHNHPDWKFNLVPPLFGLPEIQFGRQQGDLDEKALENIAVITWAMQRWGVDMVELQGGASHNEAGKRTKQLAEARAMAVKDQLEAAGIRVSRSLVRSVADQARLEKEEGANAFRRVIVTPVFGKPLLSGPADVQQGTRAGQPVQKE